MIELCRHIEVLLLENDCVIVPGLGGFIAHYRPAHYDCGEERFFPPSRTVGFNPRLVMNDGLLVQSYMQAYHTDFPDATRRIGRVITLLKQRIYTDGKVELPRIGTLYYNVNGTYGFEPEGESLDTPLFYGLESLPCKPLSRQAEVLPAIGPQPMPGTAGTLREEEQALPAIGKPRRSLQGWIRYSVAAVAAVLLFGLLSVPVGNTYTDDANYASLYSSALFDVIRDRSAVTTLLPASERASSPQKETKKPASQRVKNNVNTLKPVSVRTEKVAPRKTTGVQAEHAAQVRKESVQASSPVATAKGYYIIVASLPSAGDAEKQVAQLARKGMKGAQVLRADGRYRVALAHYESQADAYQRINRLKQDPAFKQAWVYTAR